MYREQRTGAGTLAARGLLCLLLAPAVAGEQANEEREAVEPELEESVVVTGRRPPADAAVLDATTVESGRTPNVATALRSIPGVNGVRRGQNAVEPVIRGLGWERVQTQVDGIPLHGACPARMDPPAASVSVGLAQEVDVVKGIQPVSLGPAGTGGRVSISTDRDRGADAERELRSWLDATHDSARDGLATGIGAEGGTRNVDFRVGLESLSHEDFDSGSGVTVPAGQQEIGGFLSLGFRPSATQRWTVGAVAKDGEDIDFPSLPMDADELDDRIFRVGWRNRPESGPLDEISAWVGLATVDHVMSNRRKPNRSAVEAETDSNADTLAARFATRFELASRITLEAGADHVDLDRDALRERYIVASDTTSLDHIWPDVNQTDTGLFVELLKSIGDGLKLRTGVRADRVDSEARAADDPSLQGQTVREQWVAFYGPAAARPDRDETLVSGNVQLEWDRSGALGWFAGLGRSTRAASLTERYFAFAPAPGGFLIGNPTLDAEEKHEVVLGSRLRRDRVHGSVSVFFHDFNDYIYRYDVGSVGGTPVRGFKNVDATLYGGELVVVLAPSARWSVPFTLAYVHAENDTDNRPLPEIPPLEATVAARAEISGPVDGWVELGGRFVDRQHRVDSEFPENQTPGFAVFHLRARSQVTNHLAFEVGVENLLDKEYNEHLTREAFFPAGDLAAGDEIPQPGRAFYVTTRVSY